MEVCIELHMRRPDYTDPLQSRHSALRADDMTMSKNVRSNSFSYRKINMKHMQSHGFGLMINLHEFVFF